MSKISKKSLINRDRFKKLTVAIPIESTDHVAMIANIQKIITEKKHINGFQKWVYWIEIIEAGAKELGYTK